MLKRLVEGMTAFHPKIFLMFTHFSFRWFICVLIYINFLLGRSTIGDIIKEKDKWLGVPADSEGLTKSRNAKHQQLDDALYLWFTDMSAHHAAINDEMLLTKAR